MITLGKISNFLTKEEIDWFLWYWDVLPKKIDTGQRYRSMAYFDRPFFHRIYSLLNNRVKQNSPHEEITTVNINDDYLPGGIHSDGYIDFDSKDDISLTYLIPLKISDSQEYATIIFNEKSKKAVSFNEENGLGNSGLTVYPQEKRKNFVSNSQEFDQDIYQRYLDHLKYESLAGLTLAQIQTWKLGTAMVWPRENFHCSANFKSQEPRLSLLITTRKRHEQN